MKSGKSYNIYFLDWKNTESQARYIALCERYSNVYKINMCNSLAETARVCAQLSDLEYFWMISSATDYTKFDFDQHNEVGLEPYHQVFGANTWFMNRAQCVQLDPTEYIEAFPNLHFVKSELVEDQQPLDIVYISNGEPEAEKHYQHLLKTAKSSNKIHRINGVNGRTAAYKAAANASTTAWFFAVFAKLEVDQAFDWTWRPDAIKGPMHYIFHAQNPVNGLEYGHMAMVAYNKSLTLATEHTGLDFVMTKPHMIVPVLSGVARYNQDAIVTWRTAFREVVKLRHNGQPESEYRLRKWTSAGTGAYAEWSQRGARDGVAYYADCNGEFEQLKLSYDWAWLNQYFQKKYNL